MSIELIKGEFNTHRWVFIFSLVLEVSVVSENTRNMFLELVKKRLYQVKCEMNNDK